MTTQPDLIACEGYTNARPEFVQAVSEMPATRFAAFGPAALSDSELLALMLGLGSDVAGSLLASSGSLAKLGRMSCEDLEVLGLTAGKARALCAAAEVSRRLTMDLDTDPVLNRPEVIAEFFRADVLKLEVEKFWVLCLNRKNRLIKKVEITSGTATSSLAHPREVFRAAIRHGATAIVCVHNHPSGDPAPSAADVMVTRQLREAAKAVDIELLDHVVLGRAQNDPMGKGYYSFRESGLL